MRSTYSAYVTVLNLGKSYENRSLTVMKISVPSMNAKKAIWLDGGIHAREWITVATVVYIGYSVIQFILVVITNFFAAGRRENFVIAPFELIPIALNLFFSSFYPNTMLIAMSPAF